MARLDRDDTVRAVTMHQEDRSTRYIANRLGVHFSTVARALKRFRETGGYSRRPGSGRPRVTTPQDDRYIRLQTLRNRQITGNDLNNLLAGVRNLHVSVSTVTRRVRDSGLRARRPMVGPLLTREHRRARLRFAQEHRDWTVDDWKRVLFTDETRVALNSPDGRRRVWRRPGERNSQCCIVAKEPYGGGSLMFWGGISWEARTELVPIRGGSLTAQRYLAEILEDHVMPYMPFIGENALLMHDNARPHVAHIVRDYLNEVNIDTLPWPARSPDLNPIEHLWDRLKRCVRAREPAPINRRELEVAVLEEWERIPQETVQDLIRSMPRRMEAVIRARGGNTSY